MILPLCMKTVLLAIGNLRALRHKASTDDKLIALNFLYWSKDGPVFEDDEFNRNLLEELKARTVQHSTFGDYQI